VRSLVKPNDPVLVKIAAKIPVKEITSEETKKDIKDLLDVAYGHRKERDKPTAVGLAAPQIGISKQIIAVDTGADGKGKLSDLQVFINPKIIWQLKKNEQWYEGCWSTGRVCGIVSRPYEVKVKAYTPDGKSIEKKYYGYIARIFQHEIDHLNGIEFVSHIKDDNDLHWVEENEFPKYRNNEAWRNWPNKCERKKWEKIKGAILETT